MKIGIIPKSHSFYHPPLLLRSYAFLEHTCFEIKIDLKSILPRALCWGQHWAPNASVTSLEPAVPSGIFRKQPGKGQFPGLPALFAIWREVSEWHFLPLNFSKRPTTRYSGVLRPILTPDASDRQAARLFCLCRGDTLSLLPHLEFPLWNASPITLHLCPRRLPLVHVASQTLFVLFKFFGVQNKSSPCHPDLHVPHWRAAA